MDPATRHSNPSTALPSLKRVTLQLEISPRADRSERELSTLGSEIPVPMAISESSRWPYFFKYWRIGVLCILESITLKQHCKPAGRRAQMTRGWISLTSCFIGGHVGRVWALDGAFHNSYWTLGTNSRPVPSTGKSGYPEKYAPHNAA